MATLVQGDAIKLSLLASASNNDGSAVMGTIAGSVSTPINMSDFAIDAVSSIAGFTYVVENTNDVYELTFSGAGTRFDKISSIPDNYTWTINPDGANTVQYITIIGTPSSSCDIAVSDMNPEAPSAQETIMTIKEHTITASFHDGFNLQATNYNTDITKTIYSVDSYNGNTALCLTSDTLIELSDGTEIEIGDVMQGDELVGYDIVGLGDADKDYLGWSTDALSMTPTTVRVVSVTFGFSDTIYNINNGDIKATIEHPLLAFDGVDNLYKFKEAGTLTTEDKLVTETGLVDITSIEIETGNNVEIVSIDVETQDTYVVNGYINHNKGGDTHGGI